MILTVLCLVSCMRRFIRARFSMLIVMVLWSGLWVMGTGGFAAAQGFDDSYAFLMSAPDKLEDTDDDISGVLKATVLFSF